MDFRQLTYISTIAEYGSITKAAAALFITQPSLSHYIAKTEEELGVKLFDRSTSPLTLTYAGERYLATANKILMLGENLSREMRDITASGKGRIRLGIPRERSAYMLPLILPEYQKVFPEMDVVVTESNTLTLEEDLLKGKVDMSITPFYVKDKGLCLETIYEEELVLVAAKGMVRQHHLIPGERWLLDIEQLSDLPCILLRKGHGIRTAVDTLLDTYRVTPQLLMETNSNITAYRLAAAGTGVAFVPAMTVNLAQSVGEVEVYSLTCHPITWDIVVSYRKEAYMGKAEQAFLDTAKQIFSRTKNTAKQLRL